MEVDEKETPTPAEEEKPKSTDNGPTEAEAPSSPVKPAVTLFTNMCLKYLLSAGFLDSVQIWNIYSVNTIFTSSSIICFFNT